MPANNTQKTALIDIDANAKVAIDNKLVAGYVILFCVNLQPAVNKLLIIYSTPEVI